jgi:predicted thioredoxin/glutaredoxin
MNPIQEMVVLVEPECVACVRVLETASALHRRGIIARLVVLNRAVDPESSTRYGAVIFPAIFIDGRLAFYGEFSIEDALRFVEHSQKQ